MNKTIRELKEKFGARLKINYRLEKLTTLKMGGPAKFFVPVKDEKELIESLNLAKELGIKWYIIGEGSNLVPSDRGFDGLIIKNEIADFKRERNGVFVGAGNNLLKLIFKLNELGLGGMEKMAGIPGTVGGAICGCAGAFGQEIKGCLTKVKIFDASATLRPIGEKTRWLSKKQCRFGYRESIFKKKRDWVIIGAEFKLKKEKSEKLLKISEEIVNIRKKKYPPNLLCPGSFFKNVVVKDIKPAKLRKRFLEKIDKSKIVFGKVPAGYVLEMVGAKGMGCGDVKVAEYHGNLIYNSGKGKASEIEKLAKTLRIRVRKKFGIKLEEEIQYLGL
jgi:UDP-N-acetylmuramate dehydrogenase